MTCSEFLKELTDYLDEAMDAQTKAELEDHLQWCHNCYVVCNTTKMTIEIYRESHLYELPDDLRGTLTDRHRRQMQGTTTGSAREHNPAIRNCLIPQVAEVSAGIPPRHRRVLFPTPSNLFPLQANPT